MNEINFIPDWYSRGRSRRRSYRAQYIVLGCVFGFCALWSFVSGRILSNAKAQVDRQAQSAAVSNTAANRLALREAVLLSISRKKL